MQSTRRRVLATIGHIAGLSFAGRAALASSQGPQDSWVPGLMALIDDRQRAGRLGSRYLALHAHESGAHRLAGLLRAALTAANTDAPPTEADLLRSVLHTRVRQDFAQRDTVVIDGWVLARTEARLCALYAS
jgi:hypothetical protein